MRLKPKSTTLNPRALLYKRFTDLETSAKVRQYFWTTNGKSWFFNGNTAQFEELPQDFNPNFIEGSQFLAPIQVYDNKSVFTFKDLFYFYNGKSWISQRERPDIAGVNIQDIVGSMGISKYQINKYYFAGSFSFMIKGMIEGTTVQYLKGNIIPLSSMNIKFFSDDIILSPDDLVVVDGKLYSVENPETVQKRQPKPFNIHFAVLNSIL